MKPLKIKNVDSPEIHHAASMKWLLYTFPEKLNEIM